MGLWEYLPYKVKMHKIIYNVFSIVSLLPGIYLFFHNIIFTWLFLVTILPLIVYIYFFRKKYLWKVKGILLATITTIIIFITPILVFIEVIFMSFNSVNSLWRYPLILSNFSQDVYVEHFPNILNLYWSNAKISFSPQFLQWWGHFFLKYKLDQKTFEEKYIIHLLK